MAAQYGANGASPGPREGAIPYKLAFSIVRSVVMGEAGRQVRDLIRTAERATLATALAGSASHPYASLVLVASAADGSPLLLVSELAEHTKNLLRDARLSLLFDGTAGLDDPLTGPRASVLGRAALSNDAHARARFLARHPSAEAYAGFADFRLYRVVVERAHLVAGFGRIRWVEDGEILLAGTGALAGAEADILEHMNRDHGGAVQAYATGILNQTEGAWRMVGIDPEGCDLRAGGRLARLPFDVPVYSAEAARRELVRLAQAARSTP
jgi:heme iron utilization protein